MDDLAWVALQSLGFRSGAKYAAVDSAVRFGLHMFAAGNETAMLCILHFLCAESEPVSAAVWLRQRRRQSEPPPESIVESRLLQELASLYPFFDRASRAEFRASALRALKVGCVLPGAGLGSGQDSLPRPRPAPTAASCPCLL
jgi:hypothetical protein